MRLTWKKEWTTIVILFLVLRVIYSALGAYAVIAWNPQEFAHDPIYPTTVSLLHQDQFSRLFINVWFRWDTVWYLKIAAFGYGTKDFSTGFMPLYPWLIRITSFLLNGNYLLAAILIANAACLVSLILLYELALQEGLAKETASQAVLFFLLFPTAFFLFAAYTEAPFLVLLLAAWLFARRKNWLSAGLLASVATLFRSQGVLLSVVFLWAFLVESAGASGKQPFDQVRQLFHLVTSRAGWVSLLPRLKRPDWLATMLPLVVFGGYSLWLRIAGMYSFIAASKYGWGRITVMPWTGFWLFLNRLLYNQHTYIDYIDLLLFMLALALSIYGLFQLNSDLSLYNWLTLTLIMMASSKQQLLLSFSRLFLVLFPLFFLMAKIRSPRLRMALLAASFGLQLILLAGFLNWSFIA